MSGLAALAVAPWLLLAATAAAAAEFSLELPVDCRPGSDCFVQNYVDAAPGPEARDFTCGWLSYDGHGGTDIRLPSLAEMHRGVAVLAAAAGEVIGTRDGMFDNGSETPDPTGPGVGACGNGVWLGHADGWITQYCHLKRGSVAVRRGQRVAVGQKLAEIGYSGNTAFPHLHLNVARAGRAIDPFSGREPEAGCGAAGDAPLWSARAAALLEYRASGLLGAGFADRKPAWEEVQAGGLRATTLAATSPVLVLWTELFGLRQGDVERLRLIGPDGAVLGEFESPPSDRNRAVQFRYVGRALGADAWPAGRYVGEYSLLRPIDGRLVGVIRERRSLRVR